MGVIAELYDWFLYYIKAKNIMDFEIDVSGSDIFEKDYTILVAETNTAEIILGHKFADKTRQIIRSKHGEGGYRYSTSKKGKTNLRIRLYCIAIYYIFRELKKRHRLKEVNLSICRDFSGNEENIRQQLNNLLCTRLGLGINIVFLKLPPSSIAHTYAFLIRRDILNKFARFCLPIELDEFEVFLKN